MPRKRKPAYTLHKRSNQARVRIDGRDHYLGPFGSPESRERYDELITEWLAGQGDASRHRLTVDELSLLFVDHAKTYYRKRGKPTSEVNNVRVALRPLLRLFGTTRARDFGPGKLKAYRQELITSGRVRTSINRQVDRVRRMFRWAVANEYVPPEVYTALAAVPGLKEGRSEAVESEPVRPVPRDHIDAVRPHVSRQVWAMIELQLLTGARPGEIVAMRRCNLRMDGDVWEYVPQAHKTEHAGKQRVIYLGPQAKRIVQAFLKADPAAYLFSPREAKAEFHAERRRRRRTPLTPSQRKRVPKAQPLRAPGEKYSVASYGRAIAIACRKADVRVWSPNQLRHTAATRLRAEFDIEAARTVLGHGSIGMTEIYAERDLKHAREIAKQVG